MNWLLGLIYIMGLISLGVALALGPLHPIESFLYAALLTLPAWGFVWFISRGWIRIIRANARAKKAFRTVIMTYVFPLALAAICSSLFIMTNQFTDRSAGEAVVVPIENVYVDTSDSGTKHYSVRFKSIAKSPLPVGLDDSESVSIHESDSEEAQGAQEIEVYRHPGALGLPWIEDYKYKLFTQVQ